MLLQRVASDELHVGVTAGKALSLSESSPEGAATTPMTSIAVGEVEDHHYRPC
jgi:hypothetical protein